MHCVKYILITAVSIFGSFVHVHALEPITFTLDEPGRISLAVFSQDGEVQHRALLVGEWLDAGEHTITWDGLDRYGQSLEQGSYQWKLITHPGLKANYLTALGTNPKAGAWTRWPGNHYGPTCIAVGPKGICIGAATAEGPPCIQMFESDLSTTRWYSPHYGWSATGPVSMAMTDNTVIFLQQDFRVVQQDIKSGDVIDSFDAIWQGDNRTGGDSALQVFDLDVAGSQAVISHFDHDAVRWYDLTQKGAVTREVAIAKPRSVAIGTDGSVFVLSVDGIFSIDPKNNISLVVPALPLVDPTALAFDHNTDSLLVANGTPDHRIHRFSRAGKLLASYGVKGGRKSGPYQAESFINVTDITPAAEGSFYVVEGNSPFQQLKPKNVDGLRRVAHVDAQGKIVYEWYGGLPFFNVAAVTPGNPREVYQNISNSTLARYDFDPDTGQSKLTHLITAPQNGWGDGLFPLPGDFPMYRPVVRDGKVYLHSQGRYLLRPNLETGELIPVALAAFKRWGGWQKNETPQPILDAAAHFHLDLEKTETDAFTWSDINHNGKLDAEEFRFAEAGPGAGYAALDEDFNLYFAHYGSPNHVYTGKNWINFDFVKSLYAVIPNGDLNADAPSWNWNDVQRSPQKMPLDPLGVNDALAPRAIDVAKDRRVNVFLRGSIHPGDTHPAGWPTATDTHTRIFTADHNRVVQNLGKHASAGPPRDAQFGSPSHLLGTVDGNLVVCDRDQFTTAWTRDGLLIGTLTDRYDEPNGPPRPAGDDWMAAGSIHDLGNGDALWFAPRGNNSEVYRIPGWTALRRQHGAIQLKQKPAEASTNGDGLRAEYFANSTLSGEPDVVRTDPRLWFADDAVTGKVVAAWNKNGPCDGIPAGKPFSVRWTGTITAPYSEQFWFRLYNHRRGQPPTENVQSWENGQGFARVYINNQLILDKWDGAPETNPWETPPLRLNAGQNYDLRVEYANLGSKGAQFSLVWCSYTEEWMRVPTQYLHAGAKVDTPRPQVSLIATGAEADEANSQQPGVVQFQLDQSVAKDLTIGFRVSGMAAVGLDYKEPVYQVTIPTGKRSANLEIMPINDSQLESNESCIVTLAPSSSYVGDGTSGEASIKIIDDDNVLIDDSLKLYYTFDDTDFTKEPIRNEVSVAYTGLIQHYMVTDPESVSGLAGLGEAIAFPQGRENIESDGTIQTGDYSVSFWFRTAQANCGICMAGGINFFLENGVLGANNNGWNTDSPKNATSLANGRWHHVGFTWQMKERRHRLYLDGSLLGTNTGPGENVGFGGKVQLGRANQGGPFLGGSLDEMRIYGRQLSDAEIKTLSSVFNKPLVR